MACQQETSLKAASAILVNALSLGTILIRVWVGPSGGVSSCLMDPYQTRFQPSGFQASVALFL